MRSALTNELGQESRRTYLGYEQSHFPPACQVQLRQSEGHATIRVFDQPDEKSRSIADGSDKQQWEDSSCQILAGEAKKGRADCESAHVFKSAEIGEIKSEACLHLRQAAETAFGCALLLEGVQHISLLGNFAKARDRVCWRLKCCTNKVQQVVGEDLHNQEICGWVGIKNVFILHSCRTSCEKMLLGLQKGAPRNCAES